MVFLCVHTHTHAQVTGDVDMVSIRVFAGMEEDDCIVLCCLQQISSGLLAEEREEILLPLHLIITPYRPSYVM